MEPNAEFFSHTAIMAYISGSIMVAGAWLFWLTKQMGHRADSKEFRERIKSIETQIKNNHDEIEAQIKNADEHYQIQIDRAISAATTLSNMVDKRVTELLTKDHVHKDEFEMARNGIEIVRNRVTRLETILERNGLKDGTDHK